MIAQRNKDAPQPIPPRPAAPNDLTADLLTAIVAATPAQKGRALKILQGQFAATDPEPEPYLTLKALAERLNFHPITLWRWQVPAHHLAGRPRFKASEVVAYLESDTFKLRARALRRSRRHGGVS